MPPPSLQAPTQQLCLHLPTTPPNSTRVFVATDLITSAIVQHLLAALHQHPTPVSLLVSVSDLLWPHGSKSNLLTSPSVSMMKAADSGNCALNANAARLSAKAFIR
jgi:hypothetical protein